MSDEQLQKTRLRRFFAQRCLSLSIFLVAIVLIHATTYNCILRQKIGSDWMLNIGIWLCFVAGIFWGSAKAVGQ